MVFEWMENRSQGIQVEMQDICSEARRQGQDSTECQGDGSSWKLGETKS